MDWTQAILNACCPSNLKPTCLIDNTEAPTGSSYYKLRCHSETTKALSFSANNLCHTVDAYRVQLVV